ncbi:MAG: DinB family protein [Candidatus Thorarchaeota archaeon]
MVFKNLAMYHYWANQRIRSIVLEMRMPDYETNIAGRNVREISTHITAALATCFRILDESSDEGIYESILNSERVELLSMWNDYDERLSRVLQHIPQGKVLVRHISENPIELDIMDFILQYVLHANHHRGQLALLLRELGYDVPGTDYLHYFASRA